VAPIVGVVDRMSGSDATLQGDDAGLQPFWREDLRQALAARARTPQASPESEAAARRQAARRAARLIEDGQRLVQQSRSAAAIPVFERAVRLDPDNPEAHYGLGVACLAHGALPQAQAGFHQATILRPDYTQAHFNLATIFDLQGMAGAASESYRAALAHTPNVPEADDKLAQARDRLAELLFSEGHGTEAAEVYRAVMAASPDTTRARLSEARVFTIEEDWVAASAALRRVVAHDPSCGPAFEQLGAISAADGKIDEALGYFRQAVAVSPHHTTAWLSLVSARKITADDAGLIDRIKALLRSRTLTDPGRVQLQFALGKAMEDLGDYAEAMRHFDVANRIRSPRLQFDRAHLARHVERMITTFTADFLAGDDELAAGDHRPIFILGMPRSGTTLVEQIVSSHPEVAAGGELPFWVERGAAWDAGDIDPLSADGAARIAADYSAVLDGISSDAPRVTDKLTFNFLWVGMIHALFPNAAIIHCRRNPVDTCLSIYTNLFKTPMPFAAERRNLVDCYREYVRLMAHWRVVLPADRFLEVDHEALVSDPEPVTRQIIGFCGLAWDDACLRPELNQRAVRTSSLWQVRQPINRSGLERWRRYQPWLGELRELLAGE
jgi:tetratricopeptide (TPR) repeat protein